MSEYELQAIEFLKQSGTQMTVKFVEVIDGFPNDPNDKYQHNEYRVTLRRNGQKYSFPFYGSYYDYLHDKEPSAYDILASVEKYEVSDNMWDFANEFGLEINSEESYNRVRTIWTECKNQYQKLNELFGRTWMPVLQEIA